MLFLLKSVCPKGVQKGGGIYKSGCRESSRLMVSSHAGKRSGREEREERNREIRT
jgi:hypothetical protein